MRNFLLVAFTMLCGIINAQRIEIPGKWKATEIISQDETLGSDDLNHGMSGAVFNFQHDRRFVLQSNIQTSSFMKLLESTHNSIWEYDLANSTISIKDRGKGTEIMKIKVLIDVKDVTFTFEKYNLVLQVEKDN